MTDPLTAAELAALESEHTPADVPCCPFPLYRVAWRCAVSERTGHGEWSFSRDSVQAWVDYGNREWPALRHWVEECALRGETP